MLAGAESTITKVRTSSRPGVRLGKALKMLEVNKVVIDQIVDITSDGKGAVQVYIS